MGNVNGVLFVGGGDAEYLPTAILKPGDKLSRTTGQAGFSSQGGDVSLRDIMQDEEGHDKSQGIPRLVVFLLLQRQQVIVATDNLKNPIAIGEKLHQLIGIILR